MIPSPPLLKLRGHVLPLSMGAVAALVLLATLSMWSAQNPAPPAKGETLSPPATAKDGVTPATPNQKGEPEKSSLAMTRSDAEELCTLANQLRDELNKMNAHVLSLDIIQKTEKVEKLAKKIKEEAHGH